jgi:hypothetical protein
MSYNEELSGSKQSFISEYGETFTIDMENKKDGQQVNASMDNTKVM